ncbi:MAG: type III pantothenate kinase [Synergistaceae bacterium]|nr:type III pantothenate kinase [Synergistaceae bacterium]
MTLIFDVGNTSVVTAVYDGNKLLHTWRFPSKKQTAAKFSVALSRAFREAKIETTSIDGAAYASVVPLANQILEETVQKIFGFKPFSVTAGSANLPFKGLPRELGADRVADIAMAYKRYGAPCIVVDMGTAITLDVVSQEPARLLGGAITLGIRSMFEVLGANTALLPSNLIANAPSKAIGTTTETQMQSGIVFGAAAMVDGLIKRTWKELGKECRVIATGGDAELISQFSNRINVLDKNLTLDGIKYIYELNK